MLLRWAPAAIGPTSMPINHAAHSMPSHESMSPHSKVKLVWHADPPELELLLAPDSDDFPDGHERLLAGAALAEDIREMQKLERMIVGLPCVDRQHTAARVAECACTAIIGCSVTPIVAAVIPGRLTAGAWRRRLERASTF